MLVAVVGGAFTVLAALIGLMTQRSEVARISAEIDLLLKIPPEVAGRESLETAVKRSLQDYERASGTRSDRHQARLEVPFAVLVLGASAAGLYGINGSETAQPLKAIIALLLFGMVMATSYLTGRLLSRATQR